MVDSECFPGIGKQVEIGCLAGLHSNRLPFAYAKQSYLDFMNIFHPRISLGISMMIFFGLRVQLPGNDMAARMKM